MIWSWEKYLAYKDRNVPLYICNWSPLIYTCSGRNMPLSQFATVSSLLYLQNCTWFFLINTFTSFHWICSSGVSPGRGICCAVIIVGLFISSEPQIWGLNTQQTEINASISLLQRILWPMCFALGFVPFALVNLTCEKVLTRRNVKTVQ